MSQWPSTKARRVLAALSRFNTISYAALGDGCQIKENRLYLQNVGCVNISSLSSE
ncbi:MAG: hypothetical protein DDT18_01773 [Actinobacteria bacterium]|nr:hypothetical protein [Actinomycetota bacterium]